MLTKQNPGTGRKGSASTPKCVDRGTRPCLSASLNTGKRLLALQLIVNAAEIQLVSHVAFISEI